MKTIVLILSLLFAFNVAAEEPREECLRPPQQQENKLELHSEYWLMAAAVLLFVGSGFIVGYELGIRDEGR